MTLPTFGGQAKHLLLNFVWAGYGHEHEQPRWMSCFQNGSKSPNVYVLRVPDTMPRRASGTLHYHIVEQLDLQAWNHASNKPAPRLNLDFILTEILSGPPGLYRAIFY